MYVFLAHNAELSSPLWRALFSTRAFTTDPTYATSDIPNFKLSIAR